jgi:cardiolipin synthase A/B
MNWLIIYTSVGWLIRLAMVPTVLRRQFTPGASIAWLGIVFLHPYIGLALYLVVGERRLGPGRVVRHWELVERYALADGKEDVSGEMPGCSAAIARLAAKMGRMPVVGGNGVELFTESSVMVERLAEDIAAATSEVHLLYYILCSDATGKKVVQQLKAAARRGVKCRVLADAFASKFIFRSGGLAEELKGAGVEVAAALPRSPLRRRDLRNHRKVAVIDRHIGYCGSQNLINPDYGGRRGGPWVDLTGRFVGPVVGEFAAIFAMDWAFETGKNLEVPKPGEISGVADGVAMQVVPTGPVSLSESYRRILLAAIDSAMQRLIITTPYFVPDDATMVALLGAADRGVEITLTFPEHSDNFFTASAGRAHYSALLAAGASIFLYQPGLIHSKVITVDNTLGIFGSANFDIRSFHLNFELSTLIYGASVVERLAAVQKNYLANSRKVDAEVWGRRAAVKQYGDAAVSLISPLL